ncbi:MAG TPA: sigma-70 family RNA polymerase sigma factor [Burkholderiales bacterium]|nr:sigma-70 family RNA polymerase sigma factor [Burkholderiales bacterium]
MSRGRFEEVVLPYADAAYNLARWLTRNDHDAEDVMQEAMLRAYKFYPGLRGEARPWLLAIVRNACWTWLEKNRPGELAIAEEPEADTPGPDVLLARELDRRALNEAIATLPVPFRETLILRELEDLSYKQIAQIAEVPIGTVMSRLARARRMLAEKLSPTTAAPRLRLHK